MHDRLGLNLHRDAWPTARLLAGHEEAGLRWLQVHAPLRAMLDYAAEAGAELVAYHGMNFADAGGPARARVRERARLEEGSLLSHLQRAHTLGHRIATCTCRGARLAALGTRRRRVARPLRSAAAGGRALPAPGAPRAHRRPAARAGRGARPRGGLTSS